MTLDDSDKVAFGLVTAGVLLVVGAMLCSLTWDNCERRYRREAVERGFAEWRPNAETGAPEFRWKETR